MNPFGTVLIFTLLFVGIAPQANPQETIINIDVAVSPTGDLLLTFIPASSIDEMLELSTSSDLINWKSVRFSATRLQRLGDLGCHPRN